MLPAECCTACWAQLIADGAEDDDDAAASAARTGSGGGGDGGGADTSLRVALVLLGAARSSLREAIATLLDYLEDLDIAS